MTTLTLDETTAVTIVKPYGEYLCYIDRKGVEVCGKGATLNEAFEAAVRGWELKESGK